MSVLIKRERFILGEDLELKEGLNTLDVSTGKYSKSCLILRYLVSNLKFNKSF